MNQISRRKFLENTAAITAAPLIFGLNPVRKSTGYRSDENDIRVFIPLPVQVVIDDVGWWSGKDGSEMQEPYRTGINRNHVPSDYQAIVELGRALGIRPQAAMILCEWDKENILKQVPTSTWMGSEWDNSKWAGPWLEEAADIIRNNTKHFEITLHGVGHEYWEGGKFTRAEWTDSDGIMRPQAEVEKHIEYYQKLMDQHKLGSFPKSFVPAAFRHSFGPSKGLDISLASILRAKGITYINTPFRSMFNNERVQYDLFGMDSGVITVDRGRDQFNWTTFPGNPSEDLTGPTCGMHWPNLLHPEPERNMEVVSHWVDYLQKFDRKADMMLASDSVSFQRQLVHYHFTKADFKRGKLNIDFKERDKHEEIPGKDKLTIKVSSKLPLKFKSSDMKILSQKTTEKNEWIYSLELLRNFDRPEVTIDII